MKKMPWLGGSKGLFMATGYSVTQEKRLQCLHFGRWEVAKIVFKTKSSWKHHLPLGQGLPFDQVGL